jgi:hypothetical protein
MVSCVAIAMERQRPISIDPACGHRRGAPAAKKPPFTRDQRLVLYIPHTLRRGKVTCAGPGRTLVTVPPLQSSSGCCCTSAPTASPPAQGSPRAVAAGLHRRDRHLLRFWADRHGIKTASYIDASTARLLLGATLPPCCF